MRVLAIFLSENQRDRFSSYLPYIAYDPETRIYQNADGSRGLMWECLPLWFSDKNIAKTLTGLFRMNLPQGSVMQFILYADPYIKPVIERFQRLHNTEHPLLKRSMVEYAKFLEEGTKGFDELAGIPARNFRLFVTINVPDKATPDFEEIRSSAYDTLMGAKLCPSEMGPSELVRTLIPAFQ